jgi:hypothetical protein
MRTVAIMALLLCVSCQKEIREVRGPVKGPVGAPTSPVEALEKGHSDSWQALLG